MGRAEDGHVDVVLLQFGIHIGVVHPPDTLFIPDQRRMHNAVAVVFQRIGKTDVGRAVQQHPVAGGGKAGQSRNHATQNAVFIADAVPGQQRRVGTVAPYMPADDGIVVLVGGFKVPESRVLRPPDDGFGHGGHRGKIHIGNPHGDGIKPGSGCCRSKAAPFPQSIHRDGILAAAVHDRCEIVLHCWMVLSGGRHRLLGTSIAHIR